MTGPLPTEAYEVLVNAVESMRAGRAATVASLDQRLTNRDAANFLANSRPTIHVGLTHVSHRTQDPSKFLRSSWKGVDGVNTLNTVPCRRPARQPH